MVGLDVRGPAWGGEVVELLLREAVKGRLVVLEGEVEVGPDAGDDQRRFFWAWRASPVTTALMRTGAACSRIVWLTGNSQSFFWRL